MPPIGPRSTPDAILEAESNLRGPMDANQPGLTLARRRLQRDAEDFHVTYLPIPNTAIRALHAAWHLDDPIALTAAVRDAFVGLDGELTALPHPRTPLVPDPAAS